MWILFTCLKKSRFVVRPFVGGVNAISGEPLLGDMKALLQRVRSVTHKQDYLVLPKQPWLDGIATSPGIIKQFVATPMLSPAQQEMRTAMRKEKKLAKSLNPLSDQRDLELGASVELQITGYDRTGGLQLGIIPEFDVKRMSFSKTPNTYHRDREAVGINGSHKVRTRGLDVLETPRALGLKVGDIIHMKDLENIAPERQKMVKDLWAEASDADRTSNGVIIKFETREVCLSIVCDERPKTQILEFEAQVRT
jgi:hypothetical protein